MLKNVGNEVLDGQNFLSEDTELNMCPHQCWRSLRRGKAMNRQNKFAVRKVWREPPEGSPWDTNTCSQPLSDNANMIHYVRSGTKFEQNHHRAFICISLHWDVIGNSYNSCVCAVSLSLTWPDWNFPKIFSHIKTSNNWFKTVFSRIKGEAWKLVCSCCVQRDHGKWFLPVLSLEIVWNTSGR